MADVEQKKSSYRTVLDALGRTQKRYEGAKERIEEVATEGMRTAIVVGSSFAAGAADEFYGVEDAETGIRSHKTNGAPTALLAAGIVKGAALFGLFGKASQVGYAAGDGLTGHAFSSFGREMGARFRKQAETKKDQAAPAQVEAKKEGASSALATATASATAAQKAAV